MSGDRVGSRFYRELSELRDAYHQRWRAQEATVPDTLFHYTTAAGAAGILGSGKLWATSTFHLNDEKELLHAGDLLRRVIAARTRTASKPAERLLFAPALHAVDMTRPDVLQFFAASLSEARDDLPQWHRYASAGYGLALGFSGPELMKLSLNDATDPNFGLTKVIYDEAAQLAWFEWTVDEWYRRASKVVSNHLTRSRNPAYFLSGLFSYLAVCSAEYFASIKVSHFSSEREWRLGHGHAPERLGLLLKYRGQPAVPYIELSPTAGGKLPLTEVWLGPGLRQSAAVQATRELLGRHGYADIATSVSEIPLRIEQRLPDFE